MNMKKVVVYVCLTAFFFGTMEVALKIAGGNLDPVQMTFLRFLIGGLVLAPLGAADLKKRGAKLSGGDLRWLFLVGLMGVSISMLAFQYAVGYCNAATASSIICLNPLFTMLIAHLFTTEKMDRAKWMACGIGIVAAVFMIRPWDVQPGNTPLGLVLALSHRAPLAPTRSWASVRWAVWARWRRRASASSSGRRCSWWCWS